MSYPPSVTVPSWFGPIRVIPDADFAPMRPGRKPRGERRDGAALARDAAAYMVRVHAPWFDLWHEHPDWDGRGNASWRARRAHLAAGFTILRRVAGQFAGWEVPHQVWYVIDPRDSANDGVYVHTPNPNGSAYPYPFDGVAWGAPVPERLAEFVAGPAWEFGRSDGRSTHFWVRPRLLPNEALQPTGRDA